MAAIYAAMKNIPPFNFIIDIIDEAPTQAEAENFLNTIGLMSALMLSVVAGKLKLLTLFCHILPSNTLKSHAFSSSLLGIPGSCSYEELYDVSEAVTDCLYEDDTKRYIPWNLAKNVIIAASTLTGCLVTVIVTLASLNTVGFGKLPKEIGIKAMKCWWDGGGRIVSDPEECRIRPATVSSI